MQKLNTMQLLFGKDISIPNLCTLRAIHLSDIGNIGFENYQKMLSVILLNMDNFKGIEELKNNQDINVFDIIFHSNELRQELYEALSFFLCDEIKILPEQWCFALYHKSQNNPYAAIHRDNFHTIRNVIIQMNGIQQDEEDEEDLKFTSEKARQIHEKLKQGRKNAEKAKSDPNLNLPNMIASLCARHFSYNLLNIWELTVYQLYDQFMRVNRNVNMDVVGVLLAMSDKDSYHENFWYEELKK